MAQQAPFGTDEQPSLAVKIVGGKALEVKARNGGRYDSLSRTPYKYSSRPPWFLDDIPAESHRSNKPHLTSISSVSSVNPPSQEKTNERKHDTDSSEIEAIQFMLSRLLCQFPSSKFREIYTEMAGHDSRLSGYITEHQVETSLKRHKAPIPSTVLKMVLPQFCAKGNENMINYESLIKYLFSFSQKSDSSGVRKLSDEIKLDLNYQVNGQGDFHDTVSNSRSESSYVSPRSLMKKAMDDREEAYLLVQTEQTFKTNGAQILDILEKLHKNLSKLGSGTEYINADQIERTCSWLRVPLHHTLLEKILNRFDAKKNGKVNWVQFIGFLEKAVPLSIQQGFMVSSKISPSRSPLPYWERQAPLAPVQVSPRREHFEQETAQVNEDRTKEDSTNGSSVSPKGRKTWSTSNRDGNGTGNAESSYEILKVENVKNNESGRDSMTAHYDVTESNNPSGEKPGTMASENTNETLEDKLDRFSHLTEALLRSDVDKNGTLKVRDVLRIVSNYNLIYNLHLPGDKVHEVIQNCTLDNTDEVVIEKLARGLWNLIK